jgi:hypothetical protein
LFISYREPSAAQKQLDADYKAAQKKIPDQKAADPWGGVPPLTC